MAIVVDGRGLSHTGSIGGFSADDTVSTKGERYTRTRARARARKHARTHACTHARTHARMHARTHARTHTHTHTHTHLMALFLGLPGTRKVKPIWILLKQETASGSGVSWDICKSATRSRQITTLAPHHSVFYKPDALPATQPTASKH